MVSTPCNTLQYPERTVLARVHTQLSHVHGSRRSKRCAGSGIRFALPAFSRTRPCSEAAGVRKDDPRRAAGYAPRRQAARLDSALLGGRGHNKHVGVGFRSDDGGAGNDDVDESVAPTLEQLAGAMVLERVVVVVFSAVAGVDDQRLVLGRRDDDDDDAGVAGIDDHDDDSRMVVRFDDDDPGVVRAGVELVFVVDSQLVGLVLVFEQQQRGTVVLLFGK